MHMHDLAHQMALQDLVLTQRFLYEVKDENLKFLG